MHRKELLIKTTVINKFERDGYQYLQLVDKSGYYIEFPMSLILDNALVIEKNGSLHLPTAIYDYWFEKSREDVIAKRYNILFQHFHLLYQKKELILQNKFYYKISPSWLFSGGIFCTSFRYSIGSLFELWEQDPNMLKENGYMYQIGGSALSGANLYHTLDVQNNKISSGSIYNQNDHWKNYLKVFGELSKKGRNSLMNEFKYTELLINELELH